MNKPIPIGVSPRHVHLCKKYFLALFGDKAFLTKRNDLTQGGQFASGETVTIATSTGRFENVRILGPFREDTQVEISAGDAFELGLSPPVRDSGFHEGTPGLTIIGPEGKVDIEKGVILAQRHIHMTPTEARERGLQDKDIVWVSVQKEAEPGSGGRRIVFGDVIVRVHPTFRLDFHLDTDEANAAGVKTGDMAYILENFPEDTSDSKPIYPRKRVYSERDVRKAHEKDEKIILEKGTILTPSAKDYGLKWEVFKEK